MGSIVLKTHKDVRTIIEGVLKGIFDQETEIENADKVANLLSVWLRSWDSDHVINIEKRLALLEKANEDRLKALLEGAEDLMDEVETDLAGDNETH